MIITQSTTPQTPSQRFASWILKGGRELIADATRIDRGTPRTLPVFDGGRFSFLTDGHGVDAHSPSPGSALSPSPSSDGGAFYNGGRVTVLVRLARLIVRHLNGTLRPSPNIPLLSVPLPAVGEGCQLLCRGAASLTGVDSPFMTSLNKTATPAPFPQPVAGQGAALCRQAKRLRLGPRYTVEGVPMWDEDSAEAVAQRKANDYLRSVAITRDGELWREIQPEATA